MKMAFYFFQLVFCFLICTFATHFLFGKTYVESLSIIAVVFAAMTFVIVMLIIVFSETKGKTR